LDGNEYGLIYPVWDWEEIPGITCAKGAIPLNCASSQVRNSTQTFVGGVSDGVYGTAAFDFKSAYGGHLAAKKGWFFFDTEIVALGSRIISNQSYPIVTSIAQNLLKGDVWTNNGRVPIGSHISANTWWVHHNNIGYIIPEIQGHTIHVSNSNRTGTWESIGSSTGTVTWPVFSLAINQHNRDDIYVYYISPNITLSNFVSSINTIMQTVSIIDHSPYVHAVANLKLQIYQIIFWYAGEINRPSLSISVDKACLVLVNLNSVTPHITVSDPAQHVNGYEVQVKYGGKLYLFKLPGGEFGGQSQTLKI